jgi:beta-1,4-mannosyl-glycoprotein beta-1,4-N-acetylglucosaminyltransferase
MIIDTFMFNNEFDMLDIRLAVTENYVDRWIVLEGSQTWSGHKKPYHLSDNLYRYHRYRDRMCVIKLDIPETYVNWQCENHSRSSLQQEIVNLDAQDIVIHSDLDEIINPEKIQQIIDYMDLHQQPVGCVLDMYVYKFDQKMDRNWNGTVIARKCMFENPQQLYKGNNTKRKDRSHCVTFPETAGWHWTWIGNDNRIRSKVTSCIESQHRDPEQVLQAFKQLDTAAAINHKCESQSVAVTYPDSVQNVLKQYPTYWNNPPV